MMVYKLLPVLNPIETSLPSLAKIAAKSPSHRIIVHHIYGTSVCVENPECDRHWAVHLPTMYVRRTYMHLLVLRNACGDVSAESKVWPHYILANQIHKLKFVDSHQINYQTQILAKTQGIYASEIARIRKKDPNSKIF